MSTVEGQSVLLGGIAGRYPYDSVAANVIWPVTTAKQKSHAIIEHSADDLLLNDEFGGYIPDAVEETETRGQVSLIYQKRRLILDRMPVGETIYIPRGPLVQVDAITYLDANEAEQTLAASKYRVIAKGDGTVYFKATVDAVVASGPGVVWIDMVCGFGITPSTVPSQWRQIVMWIASQRYTRREGASGGGLDAAMERVLDRKVVLAGAQRRGV